MINIGIVVLNWKQPQLTIETVDSILGINHKHFNYHIFITDNNSPDDSVNRFIQKYKKNKNITVLQTKNNLGYAGGNNFAIKKIIKKNFDYILLSNNDVLFEQNFLEKLIKISQEQNFSITGPKIYFAPGHEFHKDRYSKNELGKVLWSAGGKIDWNNIIGDNIGVDEVDIGQYDQINTNVDFISGCVMLIKTQIFKKIGVFDEKYFMYLEDADFCQRAKKKGFKIAYVPQSKVWHLNAGSSSSGSFLHDYFLTRNRLLFAFKYAKKRTKFAVFRESIKLLLKSPSVWQKKAVIDFYFKNFGKGSWK